MMDLVTNPGSYLGIMIFLILTGCGLPIPEEVPIIIAGVGSATGELVWYWAFLACLIGAIVGDCIIYAIGYHFGHGLLKDHPLLAKFLHAEREQKFEQMIQRHGLKVLFVARFMVGIRAPVYLSAGILRVPFRRFVLMDLFCATAVVGLFFGVSYAFGEEIAGFFKHLEIGLTAVVVLILAAVGGVFYWRYRKRRARLEELKTRRAQRARERELRVLASQQQRTLASS